MIHVVVAVIRDTGGRILIAKRPAHVHQGGLWEFPGGKQEIGESREQGLERELWEELNIQVTQYRPLIQIPYHYSDKSVLLDVWEVAAWDGQICGNEGQDIRWVEIEQLNGYDFPAANLPIIKACQLPSLYLVTPALVGSEVEFIQQLQVSLNRGISLVQFRQKGLPSLQFESLAAQVIKTCRSVGAKVLLNSEPGLVKKLQADGLQLSANKLMALVARPLPDQYLIAASCHSIEEIQRAGELALDFAVLSPVRLTLTHPNVQPLGWQQFEVIAAKALLPVYALGGVSREDVEYAWRKGGQGISAIRALWEADGKTY